MPCLRPRGFRKEGRCTIAAVKGISAFFQDNTGLARFVF
jgi:hypothetical protein